MATNDGMIPPQQHGASKDLKHSETMYDVDDAEELFLIAKERLLNINHWQELAGEAGAKFTLCDTHGHELHRHAHKGDLIRISIPGPGNAAGSGDDWVLIEAIQYDDYPDENGESIAIMVRPTSAPTNDKNATAHFFNPAATSTFIIQRTDNIVTALYKGRNEQPNTQTGNIINDARNALVATGAVIAGSALQWGSLLKALLAIPE